MGGVFGIGDAVRASAVNALDNVLFAGSNRFKLPRMEASHGATGKSLRIGLWTAQVVLALMFGYAGVIKTTRPIADLAQQLIWPGSIPPGLVRFIGTSELLGALGLILPSVLRIKPWLTPLAAAGLVTVMLLASVFHLMRGEANVIAINLVLGSAAAFVAWGRYRKAPLRRHQRRRPR